MGISSDLPSPSAHVTHSRAAVDSVCKTFDSQGQISSRTKILKLESNSFDLAGFFIVQMIGSIPDFTPNHPIGIYQIGGSAFPVLYYFKNADL
ncbi:hypothetical protein SAMN03080617_01748 [Algoriphagus alkaliphilus]|uniref:Uncharacterized protein n=1 Tax=Algoriphagus alkaliphilus TaxID=279824 RepID=A0A1G5XFU9_9BACT|nr:hypothetical protein SAMN03080617_01748 [Algoriphagus alkaliphilus]